MWGEFKINIQNVLSIFLDNPSQGHLYEDFKHLRAETSESRIMEFLRSLVRQDILSESKLVGRPRKHTAGRKQYYINQDLDTFRNIFGFYIEKDTEMFLSSPFTNSIIQNHGFDDVFEVIQPELERSKFRDVASKSLLNHQATIEYYNKFAKNLTDELRKSHQENAKTDDQTGRYLEQIISRVAHEWSPRLYKPLTLLNEFDQLHAIKLYRKTVFKNLESLYLYFAKKSRIPKCLCDFMICDSYLSPPTSYPTFSPEMLLFSRPFERIFDDIFLIDGEGMEPVLQRAYLIYENFAEFLVELFKYGLRS